ncbi:MAG: HEAT repeat domain-containing protein [Thermoplasmata archaeon]
MFGQHLRDGNMDVCCLLVGLALVLIPLLVFAIVIAHAASVSYRPGFTPLVVGVILLIVGAVIITQIGTEATKSRIGHAKTVDFSGANFEKEVEFWGVVDFSEGISLEYSSLQLHLYCVHIEGTPQWIFVYTDKEIQKGKEVIVKGLLVSLVGYGIIIGKHSFLLAEHIEPAEVTELPFIWDWVGFILEIVGVVLIVIGIIRLVISPKPKKQKPKKQSDDTLHDLVMDLTSGSPDVRRRASEKLVEIARTDPEKENQLRDEGLLPPIIKALSDADANVRANAALLLCLVAENAKAVVEAGALPPLITALADADAQVRMYAADALGGIAEGGEAKALVAAGAIQPLLRALSDNNEYVRREAAEALWRIAEGGEAKALVAAGAVPPLVHALSDANPRVREYAAEALWRIARGGEAKALVAAGAVPPLVHALSDANPSVRGYAAWALGWIGEAGYGEEIANAGGVEKLKGLLKDTEEYTVWNPDTKKFETHRVGKVAKKVLESIEKCKDIQGLVQAIQSLNPKVRWRAAEALGRIALAGRAKAVVEAGAIEQLIRALSDRSTRVRENAAFGLGGIAEEGFARAVVEAGALKPLLKALSDGDEYLRMNAVEALGGIVFGGEAKAVLDAGALNHLFRALSDENEQVRGHAAWVLRMIAEEGYGKEIASAGGIEKLRALVSDKAEFKIWNPKTEEYEKYTVGMVAKMALKAIEKCK